MSGATVGGGEGRDFGETFGITFDGSGGCDDTTMSGATVGGGGPICDVLAGISAGKTGGGGRGIEGDIAGIGGGGGAGKVLSKVLPTW